MLALKLILVPACLALLSLAARAWGPGVSGWLAGLPIVTGPILLFIALERGESFAAQAAGAAMGGVAGAIAFGLAYAWTATRHEWPLSVLTGIAAWAACVLLLSFFEGSILAGLLASVFALLVVPPLFPRRSPPAGAALPRHEILFRMAAGAAITLAVTGAAAAIGPVWSGLVTAFPTLGVVLAVFSQRSSGAAYATALLRGICFGLGSLVAFCLALALLLPGMGLSLAFVASLAIGFLVHCITATIMRRAGA